MAKRRRSRVRLGAAPKIHRGGTRLLRSSAFILARQAMSAMKRGACSSALTSLVLLSREVGGHAVHSRGHGRKAQFYKESGRRQMDNLLAAVKAQYHGYCVK